MSKVDDIEKAVSRLSPKELADFRAWFETFDSEQFDRRIERDAKGGKLDRLAEAALADLKAGRVRDL